MISNDQLLKSDLLYLMPHILPVDGNVFNIFQRMIDGDEDGAFVNIANVADKMWLDFTKKGIPPSLPVQVDMYLEDYAEASEKEDDRKPSLYILGYQGNNLVDHDDQQENLGGVIAEQIEKLFDQAGARHFLLLESNLHQTPAGRKVNGLELRVEQFNRSLEKAVSDLKKRKGNRMK